MISKEKQILFENFDKKNLKRNYTKNLMDNMLSSKRKHIRQWREEEYDNKVSEWKKQSSFDISKMNQTSISPTSRSSVRPFKKTQTLQERRISQWKTELEIIKEELE